MRLNKEDKDVITKMNNKIKTLDKKYKKIQGRRDSLEKEMNLLDNEIDTLQSAINKLMDEIESIYERGFANDNKRKAHKGTTR